MCNKKSDWLFGAIIVAFVTAEERAEIGPEHKRSVQVHMLAASWCATCVVLSRLRIQVEPA